MKNYIIVLLAQINLLHIIQTHSSVGHLRQIKISPWSEKVKKSLKMIKVLLLELNRRKISIQSHVYSYAFHVCNGPIELFHIQSLSILSQFLLASDNTHNSDNGVTIYNIQHIVEQYQSYATHDHLISECYSLYIYIYSNATLWREKRTMFSIIQF